MGENSGRSAKHLIFSYKKDPTLLDHRHPVNMNDLYCLVNQEQHYRIIKHTYQCLLTSFAILSNFLGGRGVGRIEKDTTKKKSVTQVISRKTGLDRSSEHEASGEKCRCRQERAKRINTL